MFKRLLLYSFAFLVFVQNVPVQAVMSNLEININGFRTLAKEDIKTRDQILTSLDKLLDEALSLDVVKKTGKIHARNNNKLNNINRKVKKQIKTLKEVVRRVKFYNRLLTTLETKQEEGPIKGFFIKEISSMSRSELYGLKDFPDQKENTLFFLNLSLALKSMNIEESKIWLFIKEFVEYVSIGDPKSLASFVSLRSTRLRTLRTKEKLNKIPRGLPLKVNDTR